jgi:hypothetical protein
LGKGRECPFCVPARAFHGRAKSAKNSLKIFPNLFLKWSKNEGDPCLVSIENIGKEEEHFHSGQRFAQALPFANGKWNQLIKFA